MWHLSLAFKLILINMQFFLFFLTFCINTIHLHAMVLLCFMLSIPMGCKVASKCFTKILLLTTKQYSKWVEDCIIALPNCVVKNTKSVFVFVFSF